MEHLELQRELTPLRDVVGKQRLTVWFPVTNIAFMATADPVPGNLPLFIQRGVHWGPVTLTFKDAAGTAINLTGYTARAIARPETGSPNSYDLEPEITVPATGTVVIEMTDEETERDWPIGDYRYDLTFTTAGQTYGPYLVGPLTVTDHPSRN